MFRTVSRSVYMFRIALARAAMPKDRKLCVEAPEHDEGYIYVLSHDGLSGFVLKPHSDAAMYLCGVFRHPDAKKPVLPAMLRHADMLTRGMSLILDCFEPLVPVYEAQGFKETHRVPFDPQFKPKGWHEREHGKPDVVFMERNGIAKAIAA